MDAMNPRQLASYVALLLASLLGAAGADAHLIWNTDHRSIWVTVYEVSGFTRKIVRAECVQPGQRNQVAATSGKGFVLRAEVTLNANCQHPVQCDTSMETISSPNILWYDFKSNAQTCWWDAFADKNMIDLRRQDGMPYFSKVGPPSPGPFGTIRTEREALLIGQYIQSPGKVAYAVQQADGNLCVYRGTPAAPRSGSWCHHRVSRDTYFATAVQKNGELCSIASQNRKTWCSGYSAEGGPMFFMAVTDDANLCVYRGRPGAVTGTVWCHNTNLGR